MAGLPQDRHGLIPMLVAIRVAAQRKQRAAEAETSGKSPADPKPKKKKRGWFG